MASTDARPVPRKNVAYRVTFPILDADGDLVTGAAGLDSEISLDGGTFADCTNEATEIATSSGMYFLDLTSGEMNADTVAIIVKTSTVGAKTTPIVMYPEELGDYRVDSVAQTGDNFARLGAPAGASVSADIAAIEGQTDDIGAAGAGLSAVPWNPAWDAEVESEVLDALVAIHLDHLLAVTYDPAAKPGAADALLNELVEDDGGVARYTANALEQAPTGGSAPTAAQNADAVWDELRSGHVGAGSFGEHVHANLVSINAQTSPAGKLERSSRTIVLGTVGAAATTTVIPTSSLAPAAAVAGQFNGRVIIFDETTATTTLRGCAATIESSGLTGTLTILAAEALPATPASGDTFVII